MLLMRHKTGKASNDNMDRRSVEKLSEMLRKCYGRLATEGSGNHRRRKRDATTDRASGGSSGARRIDIRETVKRIYNILEKILLANQGDQWERVMECGYLNNFKSNLMNMVKNMDQAIKDCGTSATAIEERTSPFGVTFTFMAEELNTLYPEGQLVTNFLIAKPEAAQWWNSKYGNNICCNMDEFLDDFSTEFKMDPYHRQFLRTTVSFTSSTSLSIFSYDLFTRLFSPWNFIYTNLVQLTVNHKGFMHNASYHDMAKFLKDNSNKAGTYAYRMSCTKIGFWTVGYVTTEKKCIQGLCWGLSLIDYLESGRRKGRYLYPSGNHFNPSLLNLMDQRITYVVTPKELGTDSMEDFHSCDICEEGEKGTRLEPCGHLVCTSCARKWMANSTTGKYAVSGGGSCPFCRAIIKSNSLVTLQFVNENGTVIPYEKKPSINQATPAKERKASAAPSRPLPPIPNVSSESRAFMTESDLEESESDEERLGMAPSMVFSRSSSTSSHTSSAMEAPSSATQKNTHINLNVHGYSKEDIKTAQRISRYDNAIALDILQQYCKPV